MLVHLVHYYMLFVNFIKHTGILIENWSKYDPAQFIGVSIGIATDYECIVETTSS